MNKNQIYQSFLKLGLKKNTLGKSLSFFYTKKNNYEPTIFNNKTIQFIKKMIDSKKWTKAFNNEINFRICLHKSLKDKYQEMIIVQDKSIITVPHKHKHGGETLNLLYGRLNVILYNANGEIKKTYILDARQPTIFRLPENTFHSYKILSNYVIYLETKAGPYIRKSNFILMKK
jgi:cupin fold WbuC family metalloprotein